MTTHIELTEDAFSALFQPKANHLNPNATCDWGSGFGTLFETYGEELEFVKQQPVAHIWTWVSSDGIDTIVNGCHFVNRIGYFLCERPVPEGLSIEVELETTDIRDHPLRELLPPLPPSVIAAMDRVVTHFWHEEQKHFYEIASTASDTEHDSHIFHSLRIARHWIDLALQSR